MVIMIMEIQTAFNVVEDFLKRKGYRPAGNRKEQINYIYSVLDYLSDVDYSLDSWFEDTKRYYPEDLVEL